MVDLRKINFVGKVPVLDRIEGSPSEGETIGEARMELTKSGDVIAHIDMTGKTADILLRGFSLGTFSIKEEDVDDIG